ncbi:hypothetical protein NO357_19065 [Marimonas arenosa]|uniref:Uncharacterized protein n=2 Tax=Marimonas arenosa TaxID=1795305 RepID=A0AAE3WFX2_9RHOB|nr:hypothetical protein [Marimonas arenosa]
MVRNPGTTLRLTVLPWMVGMAVAFALFQLMAGLDLTAALPGQLSQVAALTGYLPALVISLFVFCMIGAWVAMSWHRHILLREEAVAVLPKNNSESFDGYFDAVMKFALLSLVIFLMIKFLLVPLVPVLGLGGPGGKIISIGINALLVAIVLRHGLVLPGAAIGKPIAMDESWQATSGYSGPIYAVALCITLFVDLAGQLPAGNLAGVALQITAAWAGLILAVGVLTVLYGVRIQGRRMIV